MATGSISDEWMYNEVLDEDLPLVRELIERNIYYITFPFDIMMCSGRGRE